MRLDATAKICSMTGGTAAGQRTGAGVRENSRREGVLLGRLADAVLVVVEKKEKERETDQQVSCNVSASVYLSKRE